MEGINFKKVEDKLILVYTITFSEKDWVRKMLEREGEVTFKRTFTFRNEHQYEIEEEEYDNYDYHEHPPIGFVIGVEEDGYYRLDREVFGTKNNFYIQSNTTFRPKHFIAATKISIFSQIDRLVNEDIYIGGSFDKSMPFHAFLKMLSDFPTTHEKNLYSQARIASTIKNYFETTEDTEFKLNKYLNNKSSIKGSNLIKTFKEYELEKYTTIHEKLLVMLKSEDGYNENQWQDEILEIILLLYPKYIFACKTVYIKIDNKDRRFLDFMLVDSDGYVDVIEIKKPFQNAIMANREYRGNYPPHKDLTGTIMQLEKYLFHLNRYGSKGESELSDKYSKNLPIGLNISITNPKGFVIMGRDNNLNKKQLADFEIVKRKYKNVLDIITYDDLLRRLKFTIEQIKKR